MRQVNVTFSPNDVDVDAGDCDLALFPTIPTVFNSPIFCTELSVTSGRLPGQVIRVPGPSLTVWSIQGQGPETTDTGPYFCHLKGRMSVGFPSLQITTTGSARINASTSYRAARRRIKERPFPLWLRLFNPNRGLAWMNVIPICSISVQIWEDRHAHHVAIPPLQDLQSSK